MHLVGLKKRIVHQFTVLSTTHTHTHLHARMPIDVWEGASGASRDAPRFGLKCHSVSNGERKNIENSEKIKKFAILPSFLSETVFFNSFCRTAATNYDVFIDSGSAN